MTEVEAGEVILEGKLHIQCSKCSGTGELETNRVVLYEKGKICGEKIDIRMCGECTGAGKIPNPAYIAACKLLYKSFPLVNLPILGCSRTLERAIDPNTGSLLTEVTRDVRRSR